jgi:hypothetical protein
MPCGPMQPSASAAGSPRPSGSTMLLTVGLKWMNGPIGYAALPGMQPSVHASGIEIIGSPMPSNRASRSVHAVLIGAPLAGV